MSVHHSNADLLRSDIETAMSSAGPDADRDVREEYAWDKLQELVNTNACSPEDAAKLLHEVRHGCLAIGHTALQAE